MWVFVDFSIQDSGPVVILIESFWRSGKLN